MKFSLSIVALTAFATLSFGAPTVKRDSSDAAPSTGAAFIGKLVAPASGSSVPLGGNITFSYDATSNESATPHFPASIIGVNVGLQGPGPIIQNPNDFQPTGILELGNDLYVGGPGGWVNESIPLGDVIWQPGTYYLIVTERQRSVYVAPGPVFQVISYNVSIEVTDA
ncbi:hypothetical protein JCM11641_002415 [Rhodosporidiobolus odoratus]